MRISRALLAHGKQGLAPTEIGLLQKRIEISED